MLCIRGILGKGTFRTYPFSSVPTRQECDDDEFDDKSATTTRVRRQQEFADDADARQARFIRFCAYPRDAVLRHEADSSRLEEFEHKADSSQLEEKLEHEADSLRLEEFEHEADSSRLEEKFEHEADSSQFNEKSGLREHEDNRQVAGIQGKDDRRNADIPATQLGHEDD